ncbi:hypothetical protein M408DRAFT_314531 [Serendipita vermifera MAFF 305830]|uniref:BTB domain-containing protein n=1 Tax=Serendipita vermifera MAFF 305830 TaxID=933852 RepID=A0A0C2WHN9_SERVB|nr:hypothetical protein M408DRAFT_314531 [Serendipita vermifera MAFF 305830]
MSTTFYPREDHPSDLIIISADNVFFSVHKRILLLKTNNFFGGLLQVEDDVILNIFLLVVSEASEVFNLVLHAFYDFDPTNYKPTLDQVAEMLNKLPQYGLPLSAVITHGKPMYNLILGMSLTKPLDIYALVAQHRLEPLAVEVSHHLLATPLHNLTDEHCLSMGPIYLRRLTFLHLGRTERLKKLLRDPPSGHRPTMQCDTVDQKHKLMALWKEATGELCWEASASTPVSLFHAVLSPLVDKLNCEECKTSTREKIRKLIVDWTMVKTTI